MLENLWWRINLWIMTRQYRRQRRKQRRFRELGGQDD